MQSSTFAERVTAAVSTLVAIAILGAAVTAQQASGPVANAVADFESDLRYQIDLALRDDGAAHKAAQEAVDQTLAAWYASPQSDADRQLLVGWFDAAISATMPGHSGKLPPQPEFISAAPMIITPPPQPTTPPPAVPTPVVAEAAEATDTPVVAEVPAADVVETAATDMPAAPADSLFEESPSVEATPIEHSITIAPAVVSTPAPTATKLAPPAPPVADHSAAPPVGETPYETGSAPAAVDVNLAELNARIEGYHQRLAEIEASMVVEDTISAQRLTALIETIEQLAEQHQFVTLYYDALTDAERRHVAEPRSLGDAVALATSLAASAQDAADFLSDFESDAADPTLTDRLKALAESADVNQ